MKRFLLRVLEFFIHNPVWIKVYNHLLTQEGRKKFDKLHKKLVLDTGGKYFTFTTIQEVMECEEIPTRQKEDMLQSLVNSGEEMEEANWRKKKE